MTYLGVFLTVFGSLVVGAALAYRSLAREHQELEVKHLELDELRWKLQRERDVLARQQALLRDALHLEPPAKEPRVSFDLGAHRKKSTVLQ